MSQFQMIDPQHVQSRAAIARDLAKFYSEMSEPKKEENFSLMRAINAMANSEFHAGKSYEAGVCQAAAVAQGGTHDPQRAVIPWGVFARDLVVSTPSRGGNLVASNTVEAIDVLRPFSVVAQMGVTTSENLVQNLLIPNVSTATTGNWLADETSAITATGPVTGVTVSAPKTAGAIIKASFNFMRQSDQAEPFIRRQLLAAMAALLDAAVLQGTGAAGQPAGLSIVDGVGEQSGAVTRENMLDILATLGAANVNDANIKFLSTPAVRRILQGRARLASTDSQTLWTDDNKVVGRPANVTTDCPAATIFAGDWSQILVALWGSGPVIEVDPYSAFTTGAVQVRVLMHCDVNFLKPKAFVRHISAS